MRKIRDRVAYRGFRNMLQREYTNGQTFDILETRDAALVLPIEKDTGKIILVEGHYPGPDEYLITWPGGYVDLEDLSPLVAGARELLEETGYAGQLEHLHSMHLYGYATAQHHLYLARDCVKVQEPIEEGLEILVVDFKEALTLLRETKSYLYGYMFQAVDKL
jgi:ADP-ribose pyrophosphatase